MGLGASLTGAQFSQPETKIRRVRADRAIETSRAGIWPARIARTAATLALALVLIPLA